MTTVDVSFITVNYFSEDYTARWVKSVVRETKAVSYEILVVDNNSGLNALAVKALHPSVRVFLSPVNLGYGSALHHAALEARGTTLYFMNNDTELKCDAAAIQLQFLKTHPQAGLTGAQLTSPDGKRALSFDYFPTLASKVFGTSFLRWFHPERFPRRNQDYRDPLEVDLVSGSSLMMPAATYKQIGGFDPDFFLYCEEEDLALRVHQLNLQVFLVPAARVEHAGGGSSKDAAALKKEFYVSFFKFYRKHYGAAATWAMKCICLNQFLCRFIAGQDRRLWLGLIIWWLRGAPLSETLRPAMPPGSPPVILREV